MDEAIFSLLLIPACSILNHEGGQNPYVPNPRLVFRVIGIGAAFGMVSLICGLPIQSSAILWGIATAGMGVWMPWQWGPGFMALKGYAGADERDYATAAYKPNTWMTWLTDKIMGVNKLTVMPNARKRKWGLIYMCQRGIFMYPLFLALAYYLTPWAAAFGIICILQGFAYYNAKYVLQAEFIWGALGIGAPLAASLSAHFLL